MELNGYVADVYTKSSQTMNSRPYREQEYNTHAEEQRSPDEEEKFSMFRMKHITFQKAEVEAAWVAGEGHPEAAAAFILNPAWTWRDLMLSLIQKERGASVRAAANRTLRDCVGAMHTRRTTLASPEAPSEQATQRRSAFPDLGRIKKRRRLQVESDDEDDDAATSVSEAPPRRVKRRVVLSEELEDIDDYPIPARSNAPTPGPSRSAARLPTPASSTHNEVAVPAAQWSQQRQIEFQGDLCRLLLVTRMDATVLDTPFVREFFRTYVPGADLPSSEDLAGSSAKGKQRAQKPEV